MKYYDEILKELENYNLHNPYHIWNYVNDGDLYFSKVPKVGGWSFIIKTNGKIISDCTIGIDFIYSIESDEFDYLGDNGKATVDFIERYPNRYEVNKLNKNTDYLIYLSNNQNNINVT